MQPSAARPSGHKSTGASFRSRGFSVSRCRRLLNTSYKESGIMVAPRGGNPPQGSKKLIETGRASLRAMQVQLQELHIMFR